MTDQNTAIGIIGLGYVGLPLSMTFAEKYPTVALDYNRKRLEELKRGNDRTAQVSTESLRKILKSDRAVKPGGSPGLKITENASDLRACNTFIIAVPTPVDASKRPDLDNLLKATSTIGPLLKKGDVVIYESTVYPGTTEDICVPILEERSGLKFNVDFFAAYSPERINPGDQERTIKTIRKVTSGSNLKTADFVDDLYNSVIEAGTWKTSSIKVAEAAKVIENAQRDINIAFVNELAKLFSLLNIDTGEVLEAAATKWNFLPFKPGLVGGHCIGVDPYYLAHKAQELGYHPEIILAGRRTNDGMGNFVASELIKCMLTKKLDIRNARALILGFSYKENCPDTRNTGVYSIYQELINYGMAIDICDPVADADTTRQEYGLQLIDSIEKIDPSEYQAIILAVAHDQFKNIPLEKKANRVIYDLKSVLEKSAVDKRL